MRAHPLHARHPKRWNALCRSKTGSRDLCWRGMENGLSPVREKEPPAIGRRPKTFHPLKQKGPGLEMCRNYTETTTATRLDDYGTSNEVNLSPKKKPNQPERCYDLTRPVRNPGCEAEWPCTIPGLRREPWK